MVIEIIQMDDSPVIGLKILGSCIWNNGNNKHIPTTSNLKRNAITKLLIDILKFKTIDKY